MNLKLDTIKEFGKQHLPTILTCVGCLGVAGTGYLAYLAGKNPGKKTLLIPPVVVGGATIAAIILSDRVSAKTVAALTAAGTYVTLNRDMLEQEIEKRWGRDKLVEVKHAISRALCKILDPHQTYEQTGYGNLLCIEGYSGRIFRSSKEAVDNAIAELNDRFDHGEYLSLNDFYDLLGIVGTHFGDQFGWPANPDYIDSPIVMETNLVTNLVDFDEPVYCIDVYTYPMEGWMEV
jgi:hypothetical protein